MNEENDLWLSPTAYSVLDFVRKRVYRSGSPPTLQEIADYLEVPRSNAAYYVRILRRMGALEQKKFAKRALHVTKLGYKILDFHYGKKMPRGSDRDGLDEGGSSAV